MIVNQASKTLRILLLGAGYLGHAMKEYFEEGGHTCISVDIDPLRGDVTVDVTDEAAMKKLAVELGVFDVVILSLSTRGGDEASYRHLYGKSTVLVARYFSSARCVFCSSSALYGVVDGRWVTEEHGSAPLYPQGEALLDAEQVICDTGGVVARLAPIYGPLRCALVQRFLKGEESLRGPSSRWLNYIHRDDAVTALALLSSTPGLEGHRYNICDSTPITLQDAYNYLAELTHMPIPPELAPMTEAAKRGGSNQRLSCSLLFSLGWLPLYPSFMDGVHGVLESFSSEL